MLSAIQIIRHAFQKVEIICLPRGEVPANEENYELQIGLTDPIFNEAKNTWAVVLDVRFGPSNETDTVRYRGHLTVQGTFRLHPEFDPAKRVDMVRMNGGSLLLGAVREMVLIITARSDRGPMELATFDARAFLQTPPPKAEDEPVTRGID